MVDASAIMASGEVKPFNATVYRICAQRHSRSTLSLRGSLQFPGRYHLRGYFGALYTSARLETAVLEVNRRLTVPPRDAFVSSALRISFSRVLDLTNPRVLRKTSTTLSQLTVEDYAVCQQLGLRAWEASLEALITPSAVDPRQQNIVIFLDNQHPGWTVELLSVEPVAVGPAS